MQITDIALKIDKMENVPIYLNNLPTFSSVTYLKPNSDKRRGLYLPDCESIEALKYCKENMPDAYKRIENMICTKCDFDDISFSVFCILHELGHWIQYRDFIDEGYNDEQFIKQYELQRAVLFLKRDMEHKNCRSANDIVALNVKYDKLYSELPTEKYADDFALNHLLEYTMMIK